MATETVASTPIPITDDEKVEKEINGEKKADEQDSVSLTKESGDEILKTDQDSTSLETPPKSEAVNYEKIEPLVVEAEKIVDPPVSDVPLVYETKVESDPIPDTPEQVVDAVNIPDEVHSSTESVEREAPKEPAVDIIEEGLVEQPKIAEAIVKPEEALEVTSDKGSVETVPEEIKDSVLESSGVQESEPSVDEVEGKLEEVETEISVQDETGKDEGSAADKIDPIPPLEEIKAETYETGTLEVDEAPKQSEVTEEEKRVVEVGPEKTVQDDFLKDEGTSADKYEDSQEEWQTDKEVVLTKDGEDYSLPEATETVAVEDQKKELDGLDVVEKIPEKEAVEAEKIGEKIVDTKEYEKDNAVTEDSTEPMKEEENEGANRIAVVEKLGDEASVEVGTEENVPKLETEEKEASYVVIEGSTPTEECERKELSGLDVLEKLEEEAAAVRVEKVEKTAVGTKEYENDKAVTDGSTKSIKEDKKEGSNGIDVIEKLEEEASVKVGQENVETLKETSDEVTEESTQPIKEYEKKESSELNLVEKLEQEPAVEVRKVGEENVELSGADVTDNLADETLVKLEEVGEQNEVKIAEIEEIEKKTETSQDSSQPIVEDQKKEFSGVDMVEKLAEDAPVESGKVAQETESKNAKFEDCENKNVIDEVLSLQDQVDVNSSNVTPSEVIEKSFEGAGKDVEPAAENQKAEHMKDETPGTVVTTNDESVKEKQDEVTTLVTEPLEESKPYEPKVKGEEPIELEKAIEDVVKSDRNVDLPAKDDGATKPSEELPKEVPAKTKHSNKLLSKVKQTLVKAKRVITGKSPSSKTPASEIKDDIEVK